MLKFLRKHQKIFFAFISFFIIISFTFFGTQTIASGMKKEKDKDVSIAYDGTKIKLSEIENMSFFLATDNKDIQLSKNHNLSVNLFNDGVLRKDIFESGLAKIFFEKYQEDLKPFFEEKLTKIQKYAPFVHYHDSAISTSSVWAQYTPRILSLLDEIRSKKEVYQEFFNLYLDLYNEQIKFHPEHLRRILIFQEKQKKIQPDPRLYQDSFSLFGNENIYDWFGKNFLDLVSQFIINTSKIAEEKGYEVTFQEALSDLITNLKDTLKDQTSGPVGEYYKKMLSLLRMDEKKAGNIWQKVMLFRRYFRDVSNNTLIDNMAYKEFAKYTKTKAHVHLYKLPKSMHIQNFDDLMLFEMYLIATANKSDILDVPNNFLSIQEIEKNYPQLVEKQYVVNVKHTNLEKAALKIKVKDMYFWQLENENWEKLKNKFAFIPYAKNKKEKLDVIDRLEFYQKTQLDVFSRREMVKQNLSIVDEALKAEKSNQYKFFVSSKGSKLPIDLKKPDELAQKLDTNDLIKKYTQDNDNYYTIEVVRRPSNKSLFTYQKAKEERVLDSILNDYLKDVYVLLREKYPKRFKDENDEYKSFELVKKEVGEIYFQDIIQELKSLNLSKDLSIDNISKYRFYSYVNTILQNLMSEGDSLANMNEQFRILDEKIIVSRSKYPNWIETKAFSMESNKFSPLHISTDGNIEFIYLSEMKQEDLSPDKVEIAKEAISHETSALLTKKLIQTFNEKKCIVLPIREKTKDV